jgi:hypothetical protein
MPLPPRSQLVWLKKTSDDREPVTIPVKTVDSPQINIVQKFLDANPDHLFVLEDNMRRPKDPEISGATHPIWM